MLPNTSRIKGNKTIKFSQVTEITQETFFLKNYSLNLVKKLLLKPSLKNQN